MSRLVLMLSRPDPSMPDLRVMNVAGVFSGKLPPRETHVVLRQRKQAVELAMQTHADSGQVQHK